MLLRKINYSNIPFTIKLSNIRKVSIVFRTLYEKGIHIVLPNIVKLSHYSLEEMIDNYILIESIKNTQSLEARKIIFGNSIGYSYWKIEKSDRMMGDNNIAHGHGGKFSPYSKNFIKYQNNTEDEINNILECIKIKNKKTKIINKSNPLTLIYYTNKGNNLKEAERKLKERQTTFSLEICINKYGVKKGTKIFDKRQGKWQNTLNSKPQEVKDDINRRKGMGINAGWGVQKIRNYGIKQSKERSCLLYYIRFYNKKTEFWKIGITTRSIDERFGSSYIFEKKTGLKREIILAKESNFYNSFIEEQSILRDNKEHRIVVDIQGFKSSECFGVDVSTEVNKSTFSSIEKSI